MRIFASLALMLACLTGTPALATERSEAQIETFSSAFVMPEFAQANPEWGEMLFHENRTLGAKGCAVFSAFIVARHSGYLGDPIAFTQSLQMLDGWDGSGRLRWDRVMYFAPVVPERMQVQKDAALAVARLELLNEDYVAFQLRTPWTREHWIAVIGIVGDDLLIIDPAGGWRGPFRERYEPGHITGLTAFRKPLAPMQLAATW